MPSVPKWLNDTLEESILFSKYFREITVTETEYISDNLIKIKFSGNLFGLKYEAGYSVEFRVNETDYRRYTPYNYDKVNGTFEMICHIHSDTSGCNYMKNLKANNSIKYIIPRGKEMFKNRLKHHFVIGDETSLGMALTIKEKTENRDDYSFDSIFELDNHQVLSTLEMYGSWTRKNEPEKIIETINYLIDDRAIVPEETAFYITGNGKTLQIIRKFLKEKGIQSHQIFSQAYWVAGKKGL